MSEAQKRRRDKYRRNRGKWITAQAILVALLTLLVIISTVTYAYISRTYYVNYEEASDVDYQVHLKENEFYEKDYLGKDQAYVATLIDQVIATMTYDLKTEVRDVNYEYSYSVVAQLKIIDNKSDEPIFNPEYVIKEEESYRQNATSALSISEIVVINYDKYNDLAQRFIDTYELVDVTNLLELRLHVKVHSQCATFEEDAINDHIVMLQIPLTQKAVDIEMTSSIPVAETKFIACESGAGKELFKVSSIVLAVVDAVFILFMITFICLTRNSDITYAGRIKRIISSYKSYIQKINTPFIKQGYQVLAVDTFNEMLEIRETIQSPILMHENADQTRTEFLIPTNTKLLYMFSVQVDGYDEMYGEPEAEPTPVVEPTPAAQPAFEPVAVAETPETEETVETVVTEETETVEEVVAEPTVQEVAPEEVVAPEPEGVEVIGVVWPEHKEEMEKIYQYDPNGEQVDVGDIVLVPTRDESSNRDIEREAEVAEANHFVDPSEINYPLKKIIRVVRRKAEKVFTAMIMNEFEENTDK